MADKKLNLEVEIRKAIKAKKIVFGKKQTEEAVKQGKSKVVVISENCFYKNSLATYAKSAGAEIINFEGNSFKLGATCERQHSVSALSILK